MGPGDMYEECGIKCTRLNCNGTCAWVAIHNTDDGLHLCWRHAKEYEDKLIKEELEKQGLSEED